MATIEQLEEGVKKAYNAGNMNYARVLGAALVRARADIGNQIPGTQVPNTGLPTPAPGIVDKAIGVGEAGLTAATAATGGLVGAVGGTVSGVAQALLDGSFGNPEAADMIEKAAAAGSSALTYAPRTEAGKEAVDSLASGAKELAPLMGIGGELSALGAGTSAATPAVVAGARAAAAPAGALAGRVGGAVADVGQAIIAPIKKVVGAATGGETPKPGNLSAAAVEDAARRQAMAQELPIPMAMTKGQASRDFATQQFEREMAKHPELGAPLRQKFAEDHAQIMQNFDAMIDQTGSTTSDLYSLGENVDQAMRSKAASDMGRVRQAYQQADAAGQMSDKVDLQPLAEYLNENRAGMDTAPIMKVVSRQFGIQNIGKGSLSDGTMMAWEGADAPTVKQVELLRRTINRFTKSNDPNDVRVAAQLKEIIDAQTEGLGGDLYAKARALRRQYAVNYEDNYLVSRLIGKRQGYMDRAVAFEDVLNRMILSPNASLDQIKHIGRLLKGAGSEGEQAWRNIQGGTLQWLRDETFRNTVTNDQGHLIPSAKALDAAMNSLERGGKLQYIFGNAGAEKLRTMREVTRDIMTSPPGTINTSNTGVVLAAVFDAVMSGFTGVPAPLATGAKIALKQIKDARIRARIEETLKPFGAAK